MSDLLEPCINLWIEREGQVVMSLWRVALLEAVSQTGSISKAAEKMQIPYRVAWKKIKEMEHGLNVQLVETRIGGSDGGGAQLTPTAHEYVQRFRRFSRSLEIQLQQQFDEAFQSQC
ncbi:MAG: winged helix-turn-helix domain-containing protein [Chloroflexaceae bacterium]